MAARWTVGPDDRLVIEATEGGPIVVGGVELDTEMAENLRSKVALAINVVHGQPDKTA